MSGFTDGILKWANARDLRQRTVVPGLLTTAVAETSEQSGDFQTGIADLVAGQPSLPDITPDAPIMNLTSGGFFVLMPIMVGQEALGLVVDRASGTWRDTKVPGQADPVNGKRSKALADLVVTPFAYTAPVGAPTSWEGLVMGGPSGVAIEVGTDGSVTLTGQALAPAIVATVITLTPGGDINITVGTGNSVNIGGMAATALALAQKVIDAIDGAIDAAVSAATPIVPPNGDGGSAGFAAFQLAWDGLKSLIAALKAKGE